MQKTITGLMAIFLVILIAPLAFAEGVDDNTVLMIHSDTTNGDTAFTDSSNSSHSIAPNGNAQHNTAQAKFDTTSMYFDGTGDYLSIPDSDDWDILGREFTMDFWVKFDSVGASQALVGQYQDGSNQWGLYWDSGGAGKLIIYGPTVGYYYTPWSPSAGEWYHVAVTGSSTNASFFIDGIKQTTAISAAWSVVSLSGPLEIGRYDAGGAPVFTTGHIDEVRITKGIARWTSNFTPPIAPYTPPASTDSDGDGLPDSWETQYFGDLTQDASGDYDNDKVSNLDEYTNGTTPNSAADTDSDGMPDDWEVHYGLNPAVGDSGSDLDGDGVTNVEEYNLGTNPTVVNGGGGGTTSPWQATTGGIYYNSGNVGIKTASPQSELAVNGTITAKEIIVTDSGWADYVFEDGYKLPSLDNIESYIKENKHLPNIPTSDQIKEDGLTVSEILAKHMQKIEELTLYVIQLKKENEALQKRIEKMEEKKN